MLVHVLILGAYGLIGSACVGALQQRGASITGMGRSQATAQRVHPDIDWVIADITRITADDWRRHLCGVDVVINASGALQDGANDRLRDIHDGVVAALCAAAKGSALKIIQISAAGVSPDASTAFFRSKARGDAHIQTSGLDWIILRPTLVVGGNAYGGTALLRGVAGLPLIGPNVFDAKPVQTVALDELAQAVADCTFGKLPSRRVYDLTEADSRSFGDSIALVRRWLGFAPFAFRIPVPGPALRLIGRGADGLGWLGWRSPLRTTAIRTLTDGITGNPDAWRDAGGRDFSPLPATLARMPASLQERWFARLYLLLPLAVAILSSFWLISGLIGVWQFGDAVAILTDRAFGLNTARLAVAGGAIADILLGLLILWRPRARLACIGMICLSLGYLLAAGLFTPDLWADPLGPMVKVLPSIGLALLVSMMLEER